MPTEAEELQAKEFLKRAEIRTMKKDLLALRDANSLKERYKIVNIKTLEEQRAEEEANRKKTEETIILSQKEGVKKVLQKNEGQEKIAEKDLKNYATEEERQQIFLLESQRFELEKQIDLIDKEKDPKIKLEKNKFILQRREWEEKLNSIKEETKKLDTEENFLLDRINNTKIAEEKKSLEQRRYEIEEKRKETDKKTWGAEKQMETIDSNAAASDKSLEGLVSEKNNLKDKILGIDKSLREIYSVVMAREEEKRGGLAKEQMAKKEELSQTRANENEKVQRQQWTGTSTAEQQQRTRFLQDIENNSPPVPRKNNN